MEAHAQQRLDPMDLPSGTHVGHWCVIGRLGWGGYGAVYLVRSLRGRRRQAALKLALRPGAVARRLAREAELLERVRHPHVVRLLETGHWEPPGTREPLPFLVMEYVPGSHLYTWASQRNRRVREVLELLEQSALAVHAVHEADAVHRDIKGENLLVREGDGRLVLVDLGVGDYEGASTLTGTQLPPGTAPYRSPEALRFQREHLGDFEERYAFSVADELYALGVTWYRLLTNTFPFESEGEVGSYRAHLEGRRPADPAALNPRVPQAVSDLVLRLLSPRPEERPASAREVAEQVDTLVRSGGSELEAPLFERKEGASPHSRTTEAARAPHPLYRLPVSFMEALGALSRRWLPGLGTALVVVAVLMAVFASGLAIRSLPFTPSYPTQEGATVDESKSPAGSSPAPEAKLSPLEFDFMKSLAMVVCLVSTGCAGVPVNPTWPRDCPPETLAVMKLMGFEPGDQAYIVLDINQPGGLSEHGVYQAGPIVSVFTEEEPSRLLPVGTKVYGHMWTGGEQTQVYWTRAEMPDGREMPLCAVLGFDERGGYWKKPGPQPGTVIVSMQAPLTVTRRFERPE